MAKTNAGRSTPMGTPARWSGHRRVIRIVGRLPLLALCIGSCLGLAGCGGAFGGTKPVVAPIAQAERWQPQRRVQLGTIVVAEDANDVRATGTFHVGKFSRGDREVLERSFWDTLETVSWPADGARSDWRVHLLVRRYLVAHSNNAGGVLACVSWALATADGKVVHSEQFYASNRGGATGRKSDIEGMDTLGKVKDSVNQAIVERVVNASVRLSSTDGGSRGLPVDVEHTYASIADAAAPLPKRLTSLMGFPTVAHRKVDWAEVDPPGRVDWAQRLQNR